MTEIICYERWDYEALEQIRSLDIQPLAVKQSLDNIKLFPNKENRVMVRYTTGKGDQRGRLYGALVLQSEKCPSLYFPQGISIQGMAKWVRHFVSHKYYRDFDIANCAPNLTAQILRRYSLCPASLTYYNTHRSELFTRYSRQYGIPRDEVKTVFIRLLHTGQGDVRFPESLTLKRELDDALRQLSRRSEYRMLYKSAQKADNPMGSFAFAVWSREEHIVLMQMREFFTQLGYPKEYMVLCFDGLMVEKNEALDQTPLDLAALSKQIKETTGYVLEVEEKSLLPSIEDLALLESYAL